MEAPYGFSLPSRAVRQGVKPVARRKKSAKDTRSKRFRSRKPAGAPPAGALKPLAPRLEKRHARRHGHIQGRYLPPQGDPHHEVAELAGQTPHSGALRAHYQGKRAVEIRGVDRLLGLPVRADHPDATLL